MQLQFASMQTYGEAVHLSMTLHHPTSSGWLKVERVDWHVLYPLEKLVSRTKVDSGRNAAAFSCHLSHRLWLLELPVTTETSEVFVVTRKENCV